MFGTLFGFKGRLSRIGFLEALVSIVLLDIGAAILARSVQQYGMPFGDAQVLAIARTAADYIPAIFSVLTVWALLAVAVKRCHDRNRSGWLVLLAAIPVIGWLWLLIDLFLLGGTKGRNRYGRQPHTHDAEEWSGEEIAAPAALGAVAAVTTHAAAEDHGHGGHGHDAEAHGHEAEAHGGHGNDAETHGHGHGHDDHGHPAQPHDDHGHAHDAHGQDDHGHAHDDHGHGHEAHGHGDHGHDAEAHALQAHGHGDQSHGHDDQGQDAHDHDGHGHGHGHGDHHAEAHEHA